MNFIRDAYNCAVDKGIGAVSFWYTYGTGLNGTEWSAMCAPKSSQMVIKNAADKLCSGAYTSCGKDTDCMVAYILGHSNGTVDMCGEHFNLVVTETLNEVGYNSSTAYKTNDGHYATCLFYCHS